MFKPPAFATLALLALLAGPAFAVDDDARNDRETASQSEPADDNEDAGPQSTKDLPLHLRRLHGQEHAPASSPHRKKIDDRENAVIGKI
ncbi:MAG: hypothetical protein AAFR35_11930 [Pseudomonadota bacterium]